MPINLSPEAQAAWTRYQEASGLTERISSLEEFISICPKHKGTSNHLRMAKVRLSKLKAEQEKEKARKKGKGEKWIVPKGEDAQFSIIGMVNSGKSAFLNAISDSEVTKVGDYPFTTTKPVVGAINAKGARLQLVELPAIVDGSSEGDMRGKLVLAAIRNSDALAILVDLMADPISQLETILGELHKSRIRINVPEPQVVAQKVAGGGMQVFGSDFFEGGLEGAKQILHRLGYSNAVVRFLGPTSIDDFLDSLSISVTRIRAIIFATKGDAEGSKTNFRALSEYVRTLSVPFRVIPVSAQTGKGIKGLSEEIFAVLDSIRVYTRDTDGYVSPRPIILPRNNNTVEQAVTILSKKLLDDFRFVRIYGPSAKFEGQSVGLEHRLLDGDHIQVFA